MERTGNFRFKSVCFAWIFLVCASFSFEEDEKLLENVTVTAQTTRVELFDDDLDPKGLFKQWILRDSTVKQNSYKSLIYVLAGNQLEHYGAILAALEKAGNHHLKKNMLVVNYPFKTEPLETISNWIKKVAYMDMLPWSVIFVEKAETLSAFQVNEILSTFSTKTICKNSEYKFTLAECDKLLLLLSTNFGEAEVVQIDNADPNHNTNKLVVQEGVFRDLRRKWDSGLIYRSYRRLVKTIRGPVQKNKIRLLIESQTRKRGLITTVASSKTVSTQSLIHPSYLDESGFIGQRIVIESVKRGLMAVNSGLKMGDGPMILLFAGLPGTGKTYLSQIIAKAYNGGGGISISDLEKQYKFLHVDMGNYQDERAIDGFVDPSPGLEGEGLLSLVMSKQTRVVIVLDEIEKAHPSLLKDMLLPVLDNNEGHVQKKKTGERFPTRDSIFILTTNCFDNVIEELYFKGKSYDEIVTHVGDLLQSPNSHCQSAHPNSRNPFSWGPLWRRIMAGQALVTADPFLAFLPPSRNDLDNLVVQALENLHRKFQAKRTPQLEGVGSINSQICGLFYSDRVKVQLQQQARKRSQSRNMAVIYSFIERYIANLILDFQAIHSSKVQKECGLAVLYIGKDGNIELSVDFKGDEVEKTEDILDTNTVSTVNSAGDVSIPAQSHTQNTQEPFHKKRKFAVSEVKEIKQAESTETKPIEAVANNITNDFSLHDILSLNISISRDELTKFIITSALILSTMYFFVLPFLKMLAVMFTLVLALIMFFDPLLAIKVAKVAFEVIMFLAGLMGRNLGSMMTTAALLLLCAVFAKKRFATKVVASTPPVLRKSSCQDIHRRWALLYLRLCKRSSVSPLHVPEPMIEVRLRDRAYSQ